MAAKKLNDELCITEDVMKKACSMAMNAHEFPQKLYLVDRSGSSMSAVFSFPGSLLVKDWYMKKPFGEVKVDTKLLPCMRSIGNDQLGMVNEAFLSKFQALAADSSFQFEGPCTIIYNLAEDDDVVVYQVQRAVTEKRKIIFTGHSSGGPTAILCMLWLLENYKNIANQQVSVPVCVTFGSPLIGDAIFNHAITRENWSRFFIHFVMTYDIVPRILLSPFSSLHQLLPVLHFFNPKKSATTTPPQCTSEEASALYLTVMRNLSMVVSHAACKLKGSTTLLLQTLSSFVELSPYKPFGKYVFCSGDHRRVVVDNSEAVLQLLFYTCQLNCDNQIVEVSNRFIKEHFDYKHEFDHECSLRIQYVPLQDKLEALPLSSHDANNYTALDHLGLSTKARLCLRAAAEYESGRLKNQEKIDEKKTEIEKALNVLEEYKMKSEIRKLGYYDAFKISRSSEDFDANVKRLELAGIWDEIVEMLKKYELPDKFESRKEWIELGTRYRHIVEPLDIANYYRHLKNEDTGPYMEKGRPRRYRYTQRWREHVLKTTSLESCFWAYVEELIIASNQGGGFASVKELEKQVEKWVVSGELGKEVLLPDSSFIKWWKALPHQHQQQSCLFNRLQSLNV